MQRVEYDTERGEMAAVDMTDDEQAAHEARQGVLRAEWEEASAGERRRADDLATIAESAELPEAVREALARLVG